MGEVYLALDTRLDREVALKVLPAGMSNDTSAISRFRREALTLASLNHPNIATVHGFEEVAGGPWVLVLEHVEGVTLARRLKDGPLPVREAMVICAQIAEALEAAHERGIIHRDLKPGNVMIGRRGLVKVLDFGLARRILGVTARDGGPGATALPLAPPAPAADRASHLPPSEEADTIAVTPGEALLSAAITRSLEGMTVGTPGYMSPEQVRAAALDARSDMFAFGCVLYECLSGRRAFQGEDLAQVMRSTLSDEPDLARLPGTTPARVRALLDRCLRKDPAERTATMHEARLELEEALGTRRAAELREGSRSSVPDNLPTPATSFVGREETVAEVGQILERARLLTLAGIGGSGKTRLALRLAERKRESFPDGVWFVDVAPLLRSERLIEVLAGTLGVSEEPGRDLLRGVLAHLSDKRALLLFDNCESHLAACATLASQLVTSCRELRLIATSREPLGVEGENVYTVPLMGSPPPGATDVATVGRYESVQLFVERARQASPAFEFDDSNAGAVAEVCRRLDGIPLAIELAAARVRLLPVAQIRARLGERFKLLTRAAGAGPDRQQTVRAAIQWSWDQLLPPEQTLMARLAVFHGGWTLERATAVCSEAHDEFEMLDLLTRLVERSLVVVERSPRGDTRYRFLESVWRFALEQLASRPDAGEIHERHLLLYSEFARRAGEDMTGPKLPATMREVAEEEENVMAAFSYCDRARDGARRGQRLVNDLYRFWTVLGQFEHVQRLVEQSLARDADRMPTPERVDGLTRAAGIALTRSKIEVARAYLEEALVIVRASNDRRRLARVLSGLGTVAQYQERYEDAWRIGEEGRALYEELGQPRGVAMAIHNLGTIETNLARPGLGCARFEAAIAILREIGDETVLALALAGLASARTRLGQREPAREHLMECMQLIRRTGTRREAVYVIEALAELMAGDPATAARLLGAADSMREALNMPPAPFEAKDREALASRLAEAMGVEDAIGARSEGRKLSFEDALAESEALLGRPPA